MRIIFSSTGFLHASVYGTDEPHVLGNLDVWKSDGHWASLTICPSRDDKIGREKHLLLSGTPNLGFKVQVESSVERIMLNDPVKFDLGPQESNKVFQFIPEGDISDMQLDVTVNSESDDVPAYLKVSRDCEDVNENVDVVDYKGESIRLSFAEKGRITLSKVSIPPLTDSESTWFIGISIKNATGETKEDATKNVTLTLKSSFDYSYFCPIFVWVTLSAVLGSLVAYGGFHCFPITYTATESQSDQDVDSSTTDSDPLSSRGENIQLLDSLPHPPQSSSTAENKGPNYGATAVSVEVKTPTQDDERAELLQNTQESFRQASQTGNSYTHLREVRIMGRCCEVVKNWFKRGPKTYSYITGIVGCVLMIGAGQFVFANWRLMIEEGDKDTCFYNDFCYRVSPWDDIPMNLMISNLAYMIHGLILAISVMLMESKLFSHHRNRNSLPPRYAFSMGYAFAWALFFEGCFSFVYHLCPSKLTFQFDTGFMFVIVGLVVVLLYNGIEMKENEGERGFVDAANFFLYFLVPLYIFNYFGTLNHSETGLFNIPTFFAFVIIWWIAISIWTGWKLFPDGSFTLTYIWDKKNRCKCGWFFLGFVAPLVFCVSFLNNIPQAFLFTCIAESFIAIIGNVMCKWEKIKSTGTNCVKCFQVFYCLCTIILWILAGYVFDKKPTTDKALTPEKSRDYNQDCIFLKFYDYHDLWHIFSSHALLMTAYLVMFISQKRG